MLCSYFVFYCCCCVAINTEDNQNFNDLSPAFEPGSYVENIVENSLSTRGKILELLNFFFIK